MESHGVAHDGEPQAGASGAARAPLVDSVEALEEARQMLVGDADAVVGHAQRDAGVVLADDAYADCRGSAVGNGVVDEIVEDGFQKHRIPLCGNRAGHIVADDDPFGGRGHLAVAHAFSDDLGEVDPRLLYRAGAVLHSRDEGYIGQKPLQAFGVGGGALKEVESLFRVEIGMVDERLKAYAYGGHGGLQLMIDVVGELSFDTLLLLLLVECGAVFGVAVGIGLLQACVKAHDIAGYFAELVVGKGVGVADGDDPAVLHVLGEAVEPRDVMPEAACREVSHDAHHYGDDERDPDKSVVGAEQRAERRGIGHGRADDDAVVAPFRGIEVVAAGAEAMAPDGVARPVSDGLGYFGAVEMAGLRQRVERVVIDNLSGAGDDADAYAVERVEFREVDLLYRPPLAYFSEDISVYELEPGVEFLGFELFLAVILEGRESHSQEQGVSYEPEEHPDGEGYSPESLLIR